MYKSGDILKTNCHNIPFCFHLAIVAEKNNQIYVWHCTPTQKNKFGGNIICQSLNDFTKDRKIKEVYNFANLNNEIILNYVNENKFVKWNALTYNCETFINNLTNKNNKTTQLTKAIILSSCIFTYYLQ
jgi:hypothetical protein